MKLDDLENYRNNNGYINIDNTGFIGNPESRETRGSQEREKDWLELEDTSVLLRTELFTDEETQNYCNYAELIFEELAKQVDFSSAHYDLIQYKGKNGVLSQKVNIPNEEFFPLINFVNSPKELEPYISVSVDLEDVFKDLKKVFKSPEFYPEEIFKVTHDFAKMLVLDTFTMSTDRHLENCGVLISNGDEGKKHVKFSPTFDNECCLMLDMPKTELERLNEKNFGIEARSELQEPLIALSENYDDSIPNWQNTIEFLADEDIRNDIFNFAEKCSKELNIEKAIDSVEQRIHSKVPDIAKQTATKAFNYRKEQIIEALMLDLVIKEKPDNHEYI